ncbi:TIM barrel protein [candidate division KSB1 bacterium]|nr:TIM barrel protein [candidate division KSB1 bacterium]RQW11454.1 MAG: sugar phosphate isomerase/epimerase [candidate division KSB1 bacterium]
MQQSRRTFFKTAGAAVASATLLGCGRTTPAMSAESPLTLGMASYTFREFKLAECIQMTKRLDLTKIAFKSFHLALDATDAEIREVRQKVTDAGLDLYGGGVIYMQNEEQVQQAFHYAQTAGMRVIIGVPRHDLLDLVETKVKETDIILAIHNHGPGDEVYPTPESAFVKIKDRDSRMGLCIDIGHTQRMNLDPATEFLKFKERVLDIHVKDVSHSSAEGQTVEIGRGVIDIPRFLRTLFENNYGGVVSLEYEKDSKDPLPGAAESIGYVRGALAML